jgi:hypothetical protein
MELDKKARNLPKGVLVNNEGAISWLDGQVFICKRPIFLDLYCGEKNK